MCSPSISKFFVRRVRSASAQVLMATTVSVTLLTSAVTASAEDRSLKLFFGHTGERATITFKRDGVYDQEGLKQLNHFLRDWRRNETIRMDPFLFDIVWEMYRRSGATDYVNVVSGYRSPNTNAMLRSRSSGVAKESQHTQGKAIDFFIPGVKLATLRGLGMQMQGGGVGFYPTSGSPFVHIDVGRVRAWPRMSRPELVRLFPDGKTLHIPSDGRPLPGYALAVAEYKRRGSLAAFQVASAAENMKVTRGGVFSTLFKASAKDEAVSPDAGSELAFAKNPRASAQRHGGETEVSLQHAPIPQSRPLDPSVLSSLLPTDTPASHQALRDLISPPAADPEAIQASPRPIPLPALADRDSDLEGTDEIVTASIEPFPDAIAAMSDVPSAYESGMLTLFDPADHLPNATFQVSYRVAAFQTASFVPTAKFNHNHADGEPCPTELAGKARQVSGEPC